MNTPNKDIIDLVIGVGFFLFIFAIPYLLPKKQVVKIQADALVKKEMSNKDTLKFFAALLCLVGFPVVAVVVLTMLIWWLFTIPATFLLPTTVGGWLLTFWILGLGRRKAI